ncbi:hypothetical protein KIN20_000184 [Parelaphostrongylus tenuis]|uniref:Uncharacterized protein n=1 Tax=Parelaphostrongylus tenuis TaxID=148309 RepID=A0AAD5QFE4_PARTN|nr:hypothetical protein KIN20_000184 [Parelaphostrongylus tenuis]
MTHSYSDSKPRHQGVLGFVRAPKDLCGMPRISTRPDTRNCCYTRAQKMHGKTMHRKLDIDNNESTLRSLSLTDFSQEIQLNAQGTLEFLDFAICVSGERVDMGCS